jgi:peptide/nickel transport system permease protein
VGSSLRAAVRAFFRDRRAVVGAGILAFFCLMATLGPAIFPLNLTVDYAARFEPPSWQHILGTDWAGRDIWDQIVYGSQEVLSVALVAAIVTVGLGATVGMLSGWVGGRFDALVMLLINVVLTLPQFPIYIIIGVLVTISNAVVFGVILALFGWAGLARAVRS